MVCVAEYAELRASALTFAENFLVVVMPKGRVDIYSSRQACTAAMAAAQRSEKAALADQLDAAHAARQRAEVELAERAAQLDAVKSGVDLATSAIQARCCLLAGASRWM